jgi:membrane protein implicated in regulation of membrane protease activity
MRVAVILLAVLVFAAGLILDTGAVLALVGAFLWGHAVYTGLVLVVVAVVVGWRRLRPRKPVKKRSGAGAAKRPAGPRQNRAGSGRGRKPAGKSARAK